MADNENWFYGFLLKEGLSCSRVFLAKSYRRSEVSAHVCHYISYAIFILYFSEMMIFKFQNSSSPTFLSSHRKAFRICSMDYLKADYLDENFDFGLYSEIIQFQNFAT